jgi:hypothetical protein
LFSVVAKDYRELKNRTNISKFIQILFGLNSGWLTPIGIASFPTAVKRKHDGTGYGHIAFDQQLFTDHPTSLDTIRSPQIAKHGQVYIATLHVMHLLTLEAFSHLGLLTIIRKNRLKEREMRILFL